MSSNTGRSSATAETSEALKTSSRAATSMESIVGSVVSRSGYDLEELTVVSAGRRRLVRVVIDRDAGVDLDDAAAVSREISAELDAGSGPDDPMGDAAYTLEVTSPGIGRPLTLPRHFRRARGRMISLTTADAATSAGRVLQADDVELTLLVGKAGLDRLTLPYSQVTKAKVEVEFGAPSAAVLALLDAETAAKFEQEQLGESDLADLGPDDSESEEFEADVDLDANEEEPESR